MLYYVYIYYIIQHICILYMYNIYIYICNRKFLKLINFFLTNKWKIYKKYFLNTSCRIQICRHVSLRTTYGIYITFIIALSSQYFEIIQIFHQFSKEFLFLESIKNISCHDHYELHTEL